MVAIRSNSPRSKWTTPFWKSVSVKLSGWSTRLHSRQNFAVAGSSTWQRVQRSASDVPHSRQNLANGGFSWPQEEASFSSRLSPPAQDISAAAVTLRRRLVERRGHGVLLSFRLME